MKYVASCSFGKDSLATIILAIAYGEPLDAVVYARVMFDENRSAEPPEHEDFIFNVAIPWIESFGIKVIVTQVDWTFKDCFFRVRSRGKNTGKYVGFPIPGRCDVQRDCKLPAIKKAQEVFKGEQVTWYLGIATDEPVRLARLKDNQVWLLKKYGYTEAMAVYLCRWYGLYSPVYAFSDRGGCLFCPNQKDKELLHLKIHHPDIWNELLAMSAIPNKATDRFNRTETLEQIDQRLKEAETLE